MVKLTQSDYLARTERKFGGRLAIPAAFTNNGLIQFALKINCFWRTNFVTKSDIGSSEAFFAFIGLSWNWSHCHWPLVEWINRGLLIILFYTCELRSSFSQCLQAYADRSFQRDGRYNEMLTILASTRGRRKEVATQRQLSRKNPGMLCLVRRVNLWNLNWRKTREMTARNNEQRFEEQYPLLSPRSTVGTDLFRVVCVESY